MSDGERAFALAGIAGSVSITVAVLGGLLAYMAAKRQQRRATYSEAVKAATAWKELLYRVRRRGPRQARELIGRFHDAQDNLSYYQAWVEVESKYMARSYRRLVDAVKAKTEADIQAAWRAEVRSVPDDALPEDTHPDLSGDVGAFLQDVRSHLSPWPWRKAAMVWRNRKDD